MFKKFISAFTIVTTQLVAAPCIENIQWGQITVSTHNTVKVYRDAKVWPTRVCEWDWRSSATRHVPGIQIYDVQDLLAEVDIVILSRGMQMVFQVPQTTIDYIIQHGKQCYVGQTEEMVWLYNKLVAEGKRVGGIFHSNC